MSQAGPMSTITIALSSFIGVILGGTLSDKWVQKNIRGRVYTGAIGLGLTIPSLLLLGFGHSFVAVVGAGLLFGIGYGILMLIICLFLSVCLFKVPCDSIWYHEYDRGICRSVYHGFVG